MKVKELITILERLDKEAEVCYFHHIYETNAPIEGIAESQDIVYGDIVVLC